MRINPEETSDVEVSFIALVPNPAIEINFMTFGDQRMQFKVDAEKRIISGPAMTPNVPIYRKDASGEYNVFFSPDTIKQIALKFSKKGYGKNLNLFHDPNMPADGVAILNSFVSDKSIGIMPQAGFEETPDGTWFVTAKVESDDIWNRIKAGEFKGFSVEGNFSFVENGAVEQKTDLQERGFMADVKKLLADIKHLFLKQTFDVTGDTGSEATSMKLKDGTEVTVTELNNGGVLMIGAAPAPNGDYELEDGTKITVSDGGVIADIKMVEAAAPPDFTAQFAQIEEKFAGYEQRFAAYEQKISGYEQKFTEQQEAINKAQSINEQLFTIVQKLAETPSADPAGQSAASFQSERAKSRAENLTALSETLNKLKKK